MKIILSLILAIAVSYIGYVYFKNNYKEISLVDEKFVETISYTCADGKMLAVSFGDKIARVTQIDQQIQMTLEQISVDDENGTKFANEGDETVFWVKDQSAFLEENGVTTYAGCRTS